MKKNGGSQPMERQAPERLSGSATGHASRDASSVRWLASKCGFDRAENVDVRLQVRSVRCAYPLENLHGLPH